MEQTDAFEAILAQFFTTEAPTEFNFTANETNIATWIREVVTSDSAFEWYRLTAIFLPIVLFLGPIVGFLCQMFMWHGIGCLITRFYVLKQRIKWGYAKIDIEDLRALVFGWWRFLGRVIYNHEVVGAENVPKNCPVLFVGYHGTFPIDFINLIAKWPLIHGGHPAPVLVGDKHHVQSAIMKISSKILNVGCYTREELVEVLKRQWVMLTPGGANEVYYSDETYRLQWQRRIGFARVALDAKAAIVPYFTRNLQEAFRMPWYMEIVFRKKFVLSHVFSSIFSGLPVKLTTFYGPPVLYEENITVPELAEKARAATQQLIDDNQQIPGNQLRAVLERFCGKSYRGNTKLSQKKAFDGSNQDLTQPLIESV